MKSLLLFDIDGTLLDTRGAGRRAMERVASRLFGDDFSFDHVSFGGNLDPLIFREAAEAHGLGDVDAAHAAFAEAYVGELGAELREGNGDVEALPGVHAALQALDGHAERGAVTLGCLTGNYTAAAPLKLRHVGIDPGRFTVTAFGDEAPTRPGLVEVALTKWTAHREARGVSEAVNPRDVVVIGDTPRDVDCAKRHGCVSYAVCTGASEAAALRDAGADVVVDNLTDLSPLWQLIDR